MKKICDIVRDLLPLYAENMTSPASNELVEAHLTQCESCANYLKDLRSPQMLPQEIPVQNLKHIQKMISRRRILSVLTAVFLLLSVITWGKVFLDADVYVSADQAVHSVESLEGGGIRIHWNYRSRGYSTTTYPEDRRNWGILVTQRRRELLFPEHLRTDETQDESGYSDVFGAGRSGAGPIRNEALSPEDNYFYVDYKTGRVEKLLWGGGQRCHPRITNSGRT